LDCLTGRVDLDVGTVGRDPQISALRLVPALSDANIEMWIDDD
jgi:hypothetical protein